jgi:hypothetical protein
VLGQGHDEDPGPSRQGGTELNDFEKEAPAIPARDPGYGRVEELEARATDLEEELSAHIAALQKFRDETANTLNGFNTVLLAVEPWVGPEGQLRVRLERMEQAILALISDPHNPISAALQASRILTSIPTPSA